MSYCRWSSDNWKCDVYCYEDVRGGWTTHVAGMKRIGEIPIYEFPKDDSPEEQERFMREYKAHNEAVDKSTLEPIGLPHDGETFNDDTLEEFRGRLTMLKEAGYHVPKWVFETIDEEMLSEATADQPGVRSDE